VDLVGNNNRGRGDMENKILLRFKKKIREKGSRVVVFGC
jgi:hypothetical protein